MLQALKFDPKQKLSEWGIRDAVRDVGGEFQANSPEFLRQRIVSGALLASPLKTQPTRGVNNFTLQRHFNNGRKAVALDLHRPEMQGTVIRAYWIQQGSFADIPVTPDGSTGTVFTPDFSGCSLYVDHLDGATYRVYHVEGGKLQEQYNGQDHGLGLATKWTPDDYERTGNPRAFALMKYHDNRWWIQYQKQTGIRGIGLQEGKVSIPEEQSLAGGGELPVPDLARGEVSRGRSQRATNAVSAAPHTFPDERTWG